MGNSKIRMTHFIAMVWNEPTISLRYDCKCVIFLYRLFQIIHTGIVSQIHWVLSWLSTPTYICPTVRNFLSEYTVSGILSRWHRQINKAFRRFGGGGGFFRFVFCFPSFFNWKVSKPSKPFENDFLLNCLSSLNAHSEFTAHTTHYLNFYFVFMSFYLIRM